MGCGKEDGVLFNLRKTEILVPICGFAITLIHYDGRVREDSFDEEGRA